MMARYFFSILAVLILWVPASSLADTRNGIHIVENDKGITIQVGDAPLGKVLQSIKEKTGIQFHAFPSVLNDRISINLNAPDWPTTLNTLLEPYGRAEMWSSRLDRTEIHVLSRANEMVIPQSQMKRKIPAINSESSSSQMLTQNHLLKLGKRPFNEPLPPNLYDNPEIRTFLHQNGINSLEDMKDARKIVRVRSKALKLMLQMNKELKDN